MVTNNKIASYYQKINHAKRRKTLDSKSDLGSLIPAPTVIAQPTTDVMSVKKGDPSVTQNVSTCFSGSGITYSLVAADTPTLPSGVSINPTTGVITLTSASVVGQMAVLAVATNSGGFAMVALYIEVYEVPVSPDPADIVVVAEVSGIGATLDARTAYNAGTYVAGDVLVLFAYHNNSNTPPVLPADFTTITTVGVNTNSLIAGYYVFKDTAPASAWTISGHYVFRGHVLRGVNPDNPIGTVKTTNPTATTAISYPGIASDNDDFTLRGALLFFGQRSNANTPFQWTAAYPTFNGSAGSRSALMVLDSPTATLSDYAAGTAANSTAYITCAVEVRAINTTPYRPLLQQAVVGRDYTIRLFNAFGNYWAPEFLIPTGSLLYAATGVNWIKVATTDDPTYPPRYPCTRMADEGSTKVWRCDQNTGNVPTRERTPGNSSANFGLRFTLNGTDWGVASQLTTWTVPAAIGAPVYNGGLTNQTTVQNTADTYDASKFFTGSSITYSINTLTGVSIDAATGLISVNVAATGDLNITVTATNTSGSASGAFVWSITATPGETGGATVTVSTASALRTAIVNAVANTTILLEAGTYGDVTVNNVTKTNLVIKSKDKNNRAKFTGTAFNAASLNFEGCSGISVEGIDFENSTVQDNQRYALKLSKSSNCAVRRCNIVGGTVAIGCMSVKNLTVEFNTFNNVLADYMRPYETCTGLRIRRNYFGPHDMNQPTTLHRDDIQFAVNNLNAGSSDVVIEDNVHVETVPDSYVQTIFMFHESGYGRSGGRGAAAFFDYAHKNFVIRYNHLTAPHQNAISLCCMQNVQIYGNKIMDVAGRATGIPMIVFYGRQAICDNISIYNNVAPRAIGWLDRLASIPATPFASNSSITPVTISSASNVLPTGWRGLDVGHLAVDPQPS